MALNGRTGSVIWTRWSKHEIFALNCQGDLNGDGTTDCVAGGRAGVKTIHPKPQGQVKTIKYFQVLFALSGLNGAILWEFGDHVVKSDLMSLYAPQVKHL